ncbi:MAG: YabP/YqfC family sporulation protein [Clostridia bacterium]|nr:YabP/YqfC family sporulation protein [Clostridia bacterium]
MSKTKKPKKSFLSRAEDAFDLSSGTLSNLPNITLYGTGSVEIDNFKSLLDFSQSAVRVNTTDGIVRIDGFDLSLAVMTDESVCVRGNIRNLSFE